jgi:corin
MTAPTPKAEQQQQQQQSHNNNKVSVRQDSNVSSDSFSQNSSPSYTTKTMETPLLPHHGGNSMSVSQKLNSEANKKILNGDAGNGAPLTGNGITSNGNAALTKSMSTPASLQTIVRFHHGSNMSLHHRVSLTMVQNGGRGAVRMVQDYAQEHVTALCSQFSACTVPVAPLAAHSTQTYPGAELWCRV